MKSKLSETDRIVADTRVVNIIVLIINLVVAFAIPENPLTAVAILVFFNAFLLFRVVHLCARYVEEQQHICTEQLNSRQ